MNEHYVINLGRQLGSGGKEIGEKLAQEFGIAFYDKELIKLASEESGLCKEFFEKADKKRSAYYNYYSYKTWGAAETYHLCIDSSVLGIDGTVQFIKQFVKLKLGF